MLNLLQSSAAKESDKDPIVNHFPNIAQLNAILPNNPFFNGFKPIAISASRAQLKALGVRPANNFKLVTVGNNSTFQTLPDVDGTFVLGNDLTDPTISWDLNPSDGIGLLGPFTKAEYNTFRFNDLSTLPPNFFPNWPSQNPFIADFQQVVQHETLHVLGVLSQISNGLAKDIVSPTYPSQPREAQVVTIMDMFRFPENQVANMKASDDFKKAAREWISEGPGNNCSVQLGNAVFVASVSKAGPEILKLSSGRVGDNRQSSHLRSSYNSLTVNSNCTGALIGLTFLDEPPGPMMRPAHGRQISALKTNSFANDDLRLLDLIGWDIDYNGTQKTSMDENPSLDADQSLTSADEMASQMGAEVYQSTTEIWDPIEE